MFTKSSRIILNMCLVITFVGNSLLQTFSSEPPSQHTNLFSLANSSSKLLDPAQNIVPKPHWDLSLPITNTLTIEDFTDLITLLDWGFSDWGGNMGFINDVIDDVIYLAHELFCPTDGFPCRLRLNWDYGSEEIFTGYFTSLFGLTDTFITYDNSEPFLMDFNEHFLDLDDIDGILNEPNGPRGILEVCFQATYDNSQDLYLKVELKDVGGGLRYTHIPLASSPSPQTYCWNFRADYENIPNIPDLNINQAKIIAILIESTANGYENPDVGTLDIHHIWFTMDSIETEPLDDDELLELTQQRLYQYCLDWSSRKQDSLDIPQDRSTFGDLLTVAGIGFCLPGHIIAVEHGWITREEAATRVINILRILDKPEAFCSEAHGCIGWKGWLYHFLGLDGNRKVNFDFYETPVDESLNTVELSTIDTSIALFGILAAQSYFTNTVPLEMEIVTRTQSIYDRVEWPFLLEPASKQFYLGWKPFEDREGAPFDIPDDDGLGGYSGAPYFPFTLDFYTDEVLMTILLAAGSETHPLPPDIYHAIHITADDQGLIRTYPGALFTYQFLGAFMDTRVWNGLSPSVDWYDNSRMAILNAIAYASAGGYPTYGPEAWGISAAEGPCDLYHAYGAPPIARSSDPEEDGTVTYYGMWSAAGFGDDLLPFVIDALRAGWARGHWHPRFGFPDSFHADIAANDDEACPGNLLRQSGAWVNHALFAIDQGPALLHLENARTGLIWKLIAQNPNIQRGLDILAKPTQVIQGESGTGQGQIMPRSNAWENETIWLHDGGTRQWQLTILPYPASDVTVTVRYSNDNHDAMPGETVTLYMDGDEFDSFVAENTGKDLPPGAGWNVFTMTQAIPIGDLITGTHTFSATVSEGDGEGIEIDAFVFEYAETYPPETPILYPIVNDDGDGNYLVDWRTVANVVTYTLQERPIGTSVWQDVHIGSERAVTITNHAIGVWEYQVRASNKAGNGPWSNIQIVFIGDPIPQPVISDVLPAQGRSNVPNEINIYGAEFHQYAVASITSVSQTLSLPTVFITNEHLRAVVPVGPEEGVYDVIVTNPDGNQTSLENAYTVIDLNTNEDLFGFKYELWTNPIIIRSEMTVSLGLVVHRQGGNATLQNVKVSFYLGDPNQGGEHIGDGLVPFLGINDSRNTMPVSWTPPSRGLHKIYAVIDPDNEVPELNELNNEVSRTIRVLSPFSDFTPPQVDAFSIDDGAIETYDQEVTLSISASDPVSPPPTTGVQYIYVVEFEYFEGVADWVPVQLSGWMPYQETPEDYTWTLLPSFGVKYLQVWASDGAGNISLSPLGALINYVPTHPAIDTLYTWASRFYIYSLEAGQSITVTVTPASGDPDLYVWPPDYPINPVQFSINEEGIDEVSFVAPVNGLYVVQVFGYSDAEYSLSVEISNLMSPIPSKKNLMDVIDKIPLDNPGLPSGQIPVEPFPYEVPTITIYELFLPVISHTLETK